MLQMFVLTPFIQYTGQSFSTENSSSNSVYHIELLNIRLDLNVIYTTKWIYVDVLFGY